MPSLRLGQKTRASDLEPAIGLFETASIAVGFEATDAVLKAAPVRVLWARTVTPGRFVCLFTGEVEAVRSALRRGLEIAGDAVIDQLFIPSLHRGVIPAIAAPRAELRDQIDAVGILETRTVASAIDAADRAAKTGQIDLLEIRLAMHIGGKGVVTLTGEVSDVEAALGAGATAAGERSALETTVAIPKPAPELLAHLLDGAGS